MGVVRKYLTSSIAVDPFLTKLLGGSIPRESNENVQVVQHPKIFFLPFINSSFLHLII